MSSVAKGGDIRGRGFSFGTFIPKGIRLRVENKIDT